MLSKFSGRSINRFFARLLVKLLIVSSLPANLQAASARA
jgi:hypothetical protein